MLCYDIYVIHEQTPLCKHCSQCLSKTIKKDVDEKCVLLGDVGIHKKSVNSWEDSSLTSHLKYLPDMLSDYSELSCWMKL